jgi:hypothetical protein
VKLAIASSRAEYDKTSLVPVFRLLLLLPSLLVLGCPSLTKAGLLNKQREKEIHHMACTMLVAKWREERSDRTSLIANVKLTMDPAKLEINTILHGQAVISCSFEPQNRYMRILQAKSGVTMLLSWWKSKLAAYVESLSLCIPKLRMIESVPLCVSRRMVHSVFIWAFFTVRSSALRPLRSLFAVSALQSLIRYSTTSTLPLKAAR